MSASLSELPDLHIFEFGKIFHILDLIQRCEALFYRFGRIISILAVIAAWHF